MSWLARSIANSLKLGDGDDNNGDSTVNPKDEQDHRRSDPPSPVTPERGVKEDLSELSKTLTRQFWGVASFLAPPPQSAASQISDSSPDVASKFAESSDPEASDAVGIAGIRSDFAEIGGKFKSGISKLSNHAAVSEFTKIASNFLQLGPEQEGHGSMGDAVGVTDEVVAFARDIAMHPETWLDFPSPDDEEDDDFDMSDAQQEHALAVENLAPRLAALRIELCPGYMSEACFWKIYFVLLHPRLNKHDAELLSTPQIVKARALLTQELQNRTKPQEQNLSGTDTNSNDISSSPHEKGISVTYRAQSESTLLETSPIEVATSTVDAGFETEKHPVQSTEIPIIDKSVVEEGPANWTKDQNLRSDSSSGVLEDKYEDGDDDWLKEESSAIAGAGGTAVPVENDEDVSFSDLEDDDGGAPASYKKAMSGSDSSTKESRDWVQLSRSSADLTRDVNAEQVSGHNPATKEANDWLDIEEIDME